VSRRLGYHLDRVERRPVRALADSGLGMVWIKTLPSECALIAESGFLTGNARLVVTGRN
jgi:hypothetical protein